MMINLNITTIVRFFARWFSLTILVWVIFFISNSTHASSQKSMSFVFDNDILVPDSRDQDYTGGISGSYVSKEMNLSRLFFNTPLDALDGLFNIALSKNNIFGIEVGLYGFTPEDTQFEGVNFDDRPYSSILYLSNMHERVNHDDTSATQSTLTIGLLGLDVFSNLQEGIHNLTNSKQLLGWQYQISDGGEPTLRYQLAKQKAISLSSDDVEAKYSTHISVGYISEVSLSISSRFGQLNSSWWSFNPEFSNYGEQRASSANPGESFGYIGAAFKLRVHNSFLQGQFRDSDVTYQYSQLNHILVEAWIGYTHSFGDGYQVSYIIRAHTSEIKDGGGDRNLIWGGISLSKSWY